MDHLLESYLGRWRGRREGDRQAEIGIGRETRIKRQTSKKRETEKNKGTDKQRGRQEKKKIHKQKDGQTDRQRDQ